jgi:hypothetical protein
MTWLTVKQLAALKDCNPETIRRVLRDDQKRARVFPSAHQRIEGNHVVWYIEATEAEQYSVSIGRPNRQSTSQSRED